MFRFAGLALIALLCLAIIAAIVLLLTVDNSQTEQRDFLNGIDSLMAARRYQEAEKELLKKWTAPPERDVEVWLRLGLSQSMQDNNGEAMKSFDAGLRISPQDPRLLYNRALLLDRTGRIDEAEKALLDLKLLAPYFPEVYYHLGRLAEDRGDLAKAEEYYVKELNLNPASQSSWKRHFMLKQRRESESAPASRRSR